MKYTIISIQTNQVGRSILDIILCRNKDSVTIELRPIIYPNDNYILQYNNIIYTSKGTSSANDAIKELKDLGYEIEDNING